MLKSQEEIMLDERKETAGFDSRMITVTKACLAIDLQIDDFPGGTFPLWSRDVVLQNIKRAVETYR
jgi:hypothetical protein